MDDSFAGFVTNKETILDIMTTSMAPFLSKFDDIMKKQSDFANKIENLQTQIAQRPIAQPEPTPTVAATSTVNTLNKNQKAKTKAKLASDNLSYAQAVANSHLPPQNIKNINIVGTPAEVINISNALKKDNFFAEIPLKSVKAKGSANLTLKCPDPESANQLAKTISEKYGKNIVVKDVKPQLPMIKITKLYTDEAHAALIMDQLVSTNAILNGVNYKVEQMYRTTPINGMPFVNIVISTDIASHTKLLKKGTLVFNLSECRIFEYIELLMCAKCLKYGHFARNCVFPPTCKKCSLNHQTRECTAETVMKNMKCTNCIAANKRGASYEVRHRPTDERCESRLERIAALKELMISKN